MFELPMAALHPHLAPTTFLQAFYDFSDIHLTFLARSKMP
jgi:hypothetical protein